MKRLTLTIFLVAWLLLPAFSSATPLHAAFFSFGSATLSLTDRAAIARLAQRSDRPNLIVTGYTDDIGDPAYNAALALRRAEAVRDALVNAGYPADRIEIAARPAVGPVTGQRQEWRRVDIEIHDDGRKGSGSSIADATGIDPLRVGRYLETAPVPSPAQRDPLHTLVRVHFPSSVQRIGQAIDYLLARSGWQWAASENLDPTARNLLSFQLPESQRHLGPVPLVEAIGVLCGPSYEVVLDPVHRLVSCDLKPEFATLYDKGGRS